MPLHMLVGTDVAGRGASAEKVSLLSMYTCTTGRRCLTAHLEQLLNWPANAASALDSPYSSAADANIIIIICKIHSACAELLDVYRAAILRMQQQLRRMPSVSMASLNFSLQEFKVYGFSWPSLQSKPIAACESTPHTAKQTQSCPSALLIEHTSQTCGFVTVLLN